MSTYFHDHVNTIIHGDCFEVMKKFPFRCVDLILTDPPYGVAGSGGHAFWGRKFVSLIDEFKGEFNDVMDDEQMLEMYSKLTYGASNVLKEDGSVMLFYGRKKAHLLVPFLKYFQIRNVIIFSKSKMPPHGNNKVNYRNAYEPCTWFSRKKYHINYLGQSEMKNVFHGTPRAHHTSHPTEKQEWMIRPLIERHSRPGDIILDPMCGSGRTCVEAKRLGRNYIGIDINPDYCKMARKWLDETTLDPIITMKDAREKFK